MFFRAIKMEGILLADLQGVSEILLKVIFVFEDIFGCFYVFDVSFAQLRRMAPPTTRSNSPFNQEQQIWIILE